jgi:hypothetical protein
MKIRRKLLAEGMFMEENVRESFSSFEGAFSQLRFMEDVIT